MDNRESQTLQDWMSQSDPGAWLQAHPEHLETLSPYLGVDRAIASRMSAFAFASEPSGAALARGRSSLMAAVNDRTPSIASSGLRTWRPAHAGAMVAVALAAIGLTTGASAALGGGGLGQAVLDALMGPTEEHQEGINNSNENADNGRAHANENAFEGSGNADDHAANGNAGECNAAENAGANIAPQANPNAPEQCGNAPDGQGNAGDNPGGKPDDPGGAAPTPQGGNPQGDPQ